MFSATLTARNFQIYYAIQFNQAPSAVQAGLNTLAASGNIAAPKSNQRVILGNSNGVETYSLAQGKGSKVAPNPHFTVDTNGDIVTASTKTTTTFGAIPNSAVTDEFDAIATGLNLTAPTSTDNVIVTTRGNGQVIYTLTLHGTGALKGGKISVDDTGLPVGNEIGASEKVPFSALTSTIQNGLNANAPAGATAIGAGSTQKVLVKTLNGITTYSVEFVVSSVRTTVTVNAAGAVTALPSQSNDVFSNIPVAAKDELQKLAEDNGFDGTIKSSHAVNVYDEANGTVVYGVSISEHVHGGIHEFALWVDEDGNPTIRSTDGEVGIIHLLSGGIARAPKADGSWIMDI